MVEMIHLSFVWGCSFLFFVFSFFCSHNLGFELIFFFSGKISYLNISEVPCMSLGPVCTCPFGDQKLFFNYS